VQEKLLTMIVLDSTAPGPRLGLAISARAVPLAVSRNRIKRLARETFRARRAALPSADIVLQARSAAAGAPAAEVRATLERMWRRLGGS
jgi:ribonuclease P protein component